MRQELRQLLQALRQKAIFEGRWEPQTWGWAWSAELRWVSLAPVKGPGSPFLRLVPWKEPLSFLSVHFMQGPDPGLGPV